MTEDIPQQQGLYDSKYEHDSCGIGFVASIQGERSNEIIQRGIEVLERMAHRGAQSADNKTGDGAGILMQIPHEFYKQLIPTLPERGQYGTGILFLPRDPAEATYCTDEFERVVEEEGLDFLMWRDVPLESAVLGQIARGAEPVMRQAFIGTKTPLTREELERKLYVVRKVIENRIRKSQLAQAR